jgi:hypothetical protein
VQFALLWPLLLLSAAQAPAQAEEERWGDWCPYHWDTGSSTPVSPTLDGGAGLALRLKPREMTHAGVCDIPAGLLGSYLLRAGLVIFLVVLWFELRASHMLGRCCAT